MPGPLSALPPPGSGFTTEQWSQIATQVQSDPRGRIDDAMWRGFSDAQRSAIIQLRRDLRSDGWGGPQRQPGGDRLDGGSAGHWSGNVDPVSGQRPQRPQQPNQPRTTLEEVLDAAKAAPPNAEVVTPWDPLPDNRVLFYFQNTENLFREADDPDHKDEEFTVAAGYTKDKFYRHLQNVSLPNKYMNGGRGADGLGYIEVEDRRALEKLVALDMEGMGYDNIQLGGVHHVITFDANGNPVKELETDYQRRMGQPVDGDGDDVKEGKDMRGIDVGLVTRFPLWPGTRAQLLFTAAPNDGQRGILRVELNVRGKHEVTYVNHWKSMRDGEETSAEENKRIAQVLDADIALTLAADPTISIVGGGDFNTKYYDGDQTAMNALGAHKTDDAVAPTELYDATNSITERRDRGVNDPLLPAGTHSYRGGSDFLDRLMVNGNVVQGTGGMKLVKNSVVVIPNAGRYFGKNNGTNPEGLSDHKGLAAQFEIS
jgi:hypothetical protein